LAAAQCAPHVGCLPGADSQKIGSVGSSGCFEKLPLQRRQRLLVFADQQGIGQVEEVLTLWLG